MRYQDHFFILKFTSSHHNFQTDKQYSWNLDVDIQTSFPYNCFQFGASSSLYIGGPASECEMFESLWVINNDQMGHSNVGPYIETRTSTELKTIIRKWCLNIDIQISWVLLIRLKIMMRWDKIFVSNKNIILITHSIIAFLCWVTWVKFGFRKGLTVKSWHIFKIIVTNCIGGTRHVCHFGHDRDQICLPY